MKLRANRDLIIIISTLVLAGIYLIVRSSYSIIDKKFTYSIVNSCASKSLLLYENESLAEDYANWYETGKLIFPVGTAVNRYQTIPLNMSDTVFVISYSEDSLFAKVKFKNPDYGKYKRLMIDEYYKGFLPTKLLHDTPVPDSIKHCN